MIRLTLFELRERWLQMLLAAAFQVLVTPLGNPMHLQGSSLLLGLIAGFLCAHRDAACGTSDYVRHRGIGVERQHIARSAAFAIAATAWIVWPPLFWHFGPGRELGGHTAWYWMSTCTGILSGFGVAAWATSLPMLGSVRMAFGAMACMALLIGLNPLIGQKLWTFALVNVAVFALGTASSARLLALGRDDDVPRTRRGVWLDHALLALVVMLGVHVFSSILEADWQRHGRWAQTFLTAVRSPVSTTIADVFGLGNPATLLMEPSRLVFVRSGAASLGALACWSLALPLAGQAAYALRRAGAPRSRAMFWVVTILVTGLAGAIARVAIEPARRWRGYREAVPEGPPPLFSAP